MTAGNRDRANDCPECTGEGAVTIRHSRPGYSQEQERRVVCPVCGGSGRRQVRHHSTLPLPDAATLSSDQHDRVRASGEDLSYRGFRVRCMYLSKSKEKDEWTFELAEYDMGDPAGCGLTLADCIEQIDEAVNEGV